MDESQKPTTQLKILCVEDEHFISELYSRALTRAGHTVTTIIDGNEALATAQKETFDVILLDIMLPNKTGLQILDELRTSNPDLKAKIIISTNLEQSEESRKEVEEKADGYIVKAEMTPRQLVEYLNQFHIEPVS